MNKLLWLLGSLLATSAVFADSDVRLEPYGTARTIDFRILAADGTYVTNATDGGTDVTLTCDDGSPATATNDFADEGSHYSIALTATEMQCARLVVDVADAIANGFIIETYGNASAQHTQFPANVLAWNSTALSTTNPLPNAVAGASGGLLISGSNAGTTTLGALTITGATTHTGATTYTGAVTGTNASNNFRINGIAPGAAGGVLIAGTNADFDVTANVGLAGGLNITQSTANTAALVVTGNGTGNGATITSGSGATGTGLALVAASTNGAALTAAGAGSGNGATMTGGATGHGLSVVGGATSGNGFRATGTAGNSAAANLIGQGSAAGLLSTGGATGAGVSLVGGATSGAGLAVTASAGNSTALTATGQGTGAGASFTSGSGATGNGIAATAASTNGNGMSLTGNGSGAGLAGTGFSTFDASATGVFLSTSVNNCRVAIGCETQGTLSGTHTATTADLGTSAPSSSTEVVGMTLVVSGKTRRIVTSYDSGTGVATFAPPTALTLANGDQWYLWDTPPSPTPSQDTYEALPLNCTVNTANFAGSTTTLACILTDIYGAAVTQASGDLEGLEIAITSGADVREKRFINDTTWDGTHNELQLTLSRALPSTQADAITAIIR